MRWVVILCAAGLVGLLAYGVASQEEDKSIDEAVARGERIDAPLRTLSRLGADGEATLEEYRGKVVVLNFWASWCPPCVDELPLLQETHHNIGPEGVVLGINYRDISDDALGFVRRFDLTFDNLRDPNGEYAEDFASRAFPETFLIDRDGRIADTRRGPVTEKWLAEHLTPLLNER